MEIKDIKEKLTLSEVIKYYGFKADKYNRIHCPFHHDKTPSMQLYWKTHIAYCFSGNCTTHGKSLDVIDFIMNMEKSTKHQAIKKAESFIGGSGEEAIGNRENREVILTKMFTYFKNAVHNSKPAQEYIQSRNLDPTRIEIGYNSAQFHHGARKDEALIQSCVEVGLLTPWGTNSKSGGQAYKPFAKECICFALRNRANQITGMYFRSTINDKDSRHFYLKDRQGLYPHYPQSETKILILTESIIDAASLIQAIGNGQEGIGDYEVLACYGTNGLTGEHEEAIKELKELEEIIFFLNGDEAGKKATLKHSATLQALKPGIKITQVNVPENEDVNSLMQSHEPGIFNHLLDSRESLVMSHEINEPIALHEIPLTTQDSGLKTKNSVLITKNPYKLEYHTETANYYIQGGISKMLDSMKVTLVIEHPQTLKKSRNKLDLYEDKQTEKICKESSEKLNLRKDLLESDLYKLIDLLDQYRERELTSKSEEHQEIPLTAEERKQAEAFLKKADIIKRLNELLGKAGITGEENSRIFLLLIALSYKMPETLHALIQGSSGSGKTRLLKQISDCMPQEKVTKLTRISDKVLYNYPEKYFVNRLLCLEDIDGLSEEAEFAFRELQSNGELNSASSMKLENGQIVAGQKTVKGPIASLACTTHGEIYEDNMSRCFLVAVDESAAQTERVLQYQNRKAAGKLQEEEEKNVKKTIQNLVRILEPLKVINPYADQLQLPKEAHKIRRLNELFQSFVKQVTLVNQYQRKQDEKGRLIAELQDLEQAIAIMFESIVLKVDELDGSLRQFYENLKEHIKKNYNGSHQKAEFSQREIRHALHVSKAQVHRYLSTLIELEYLQVAGGYANRGFKFKIIYWDDYKALRERVKKNLSQQLKDLL